mmetsp:Transcript_67089/g.151673  ORF Transcript_67089/g.151673 Transcript_67089/m.151673 type:complete len:141 (+) Transcript_67089:95-517(+)
MDELEEKIRRAMSSGGAGPLAGETAFSPIPRVNDSVGWGSFHETGEGHSTRESFHRSFGGELDGSFDRDLFGRGPVASEASSGPAGSSSEAEQLSTMDFLLAVRRLDRAAAAAAAATAAAAAAAIRAARLAPHSGGPVVE